MEAPDISMQAQMGYGCALLMLSPMSQLEQKVLTASGCVCMRPADWSLTSQHEQMQAALQGPDCTAIFTGLPAFSPTLKSL